MKRLAAASALTLALALAHGGTAEGAEPAGGCARGSDPWLRLDLGSSFPGPLASAVSAKLEAQLGRSNIGVCTSEPTAASTTGGASGTDTPGSEPLAVVRLTLEADDTLSLEVSDRATDKRLERSISLRGIPKDTLAFSIALAAEELLHASWFEALVDRARAPAAATPPPAVVTEVAVESLSPAVRSPRAVGPSLTLLFAGEHATGGLSMGGIDARASYGGLLRAELRVGYRVGLTSAASDGAVDSSAFLAGVSVAFGSPRSAPWGVEVFARGDALRVTFSGRGTGTTEGTGDAAFGALLGGGAAGWRVVDASGVWRVIVEASLAAPLRAVAALDDGQSTTALSGATVGAAIGLGAAL